MGSTESKFVEIKMTWTDAAEIIIAVLRDSGTREGREAAAKELRNMARTADMAPILLDLVRRLLPSVRLRCPDHGSITAELIAEAEAVIARAA